jgi:hypothetical protein
MRRSNIKFMIVGLGRAVDASSTKRAEDLDQTGDIVSTVDHLAGLGMKDALPAARWCRSHQRRRQDHDDVLASVARFERGIVIERTQPGLRRTWPEGKTSGHKHAPSEAQRAEGRTALERGSHERGDLANQYETSRQTILRAKPTLPREHSPDAATRIQRGPTVRLGRGPHKRRRGPR